ncbi:MAG: glycosyltransferase family 2 protein, partial [Helicobacter sp.]|nr:glycosyltransferase family 2 protein [Helicobacter sp.]
MKLILFGTAVSRVKNHLAYKLGEIFTKDLKTFSGILKLLFRILMVSYKHNKERKQYNQKIQNNLN